MTTAEIYNLNDKALSNLHDYIHLEMERREHIDELVHDINHKLAELMDELRGEDLFLMNNLTGELVVNINEWDDPDGDLNPELIVMRKAD